MSDENPASKANTTSQAGPPRPNYRDSIFAQCDRVNAMMSQGEDYTEAVNALRIFTVGEQDDEFRKAWGALPLRQVGGVYLPTRAQSARVYELVMELLSRRGITTQRRIVSPLVP